MGEAALQLPELDWELLSYMIGLILMILQNRWKDPF